MSSFTLDHHGGDAVPRVAVGDLLRYPNVVHRVLSVREVNSRKWPDRWRVETERVGVPQPPDAEWEAWRAESIARFGRCAVRPVSRYARDEQPGDRPCGHSACEGCTELPASVEPDDMPA